MVSEWTADLHRRAFHFWTEGYTFEEFISEETHYRVLLVRGQPHKAPFVLSMHALARSRFPK
jgi:hypothetical protein